MTHSLTNNLLHDNSQTFMYLNSQQLLIPHAYMYVSFYGFIENAPYFIFLLVNIAYYDFWGFVVHSLQAQIHYIPMMHRFIKTEGTKNVMSMFIHTMHNENDDYDGVIECVPKIAARNLILFYLL